MSVASLIEAPVIDSPVVLFAGSAEARALADRLGALAQVRLLTPERRTRKWPKPPLLGSSPIPPHSQIVVDATHPCDAAGSRAAAAAAQAAGCRLLRLERPGWRATRSDQWCFVRTEHDIARQVPAGSVVFAALGRRGLRALRTLKDCYVYSRQITPHRAPFPLARGRFWPGDAPFRIDQEVALFQRLGITCLVVRNAGGPGGWPKLAAARKLGLRVILVDRPKLACAPLVRDVDSAEQRIKAWLR